MKTRFEVEWCINIPRDATGEFSPADAEFKKKYFEDFKSALLFARRIFFEDQFGCPLITEQSQYLTEDRVILWEDTRRVRLEGEHEVCTEKDLERCA